MNFTSTNTIAETLAAHLNTLTDEQAQPLLKTVKVIHGSNDFKKIFETLPDLTDFPAAVISLGSVNYEHGGVTRRVECNVTLIERPYGIAEQEAAAQTHLEKLLDALTGNTAGQVLRLEGIPFVMGNIIQDEDFPDEYVAWKISLIVLDTNNIMCYITMPKYGGRYDENSTRCQKYFCEAQRITA